MATPTIISAQNLSLSYGVRPLFTGLSFTIHQGDRIGLIGPNGAGKSSLMKILAQLIKADSGIVSTQKGLRVGYLAQEPVFSDDATVESTILEGATDPYDWEEIHRSHVIMTKLSLDGGTVQPDSLVSSLSGGWRKRVALGRELQKQPDLLLLDEPTNHLDIEGILDLEDLLSDARFAVLTITHDRYFLDRVSSRIFELDRKNENGILIIEGSYAAYLETKQNLMDAQNQQEIRLKNTLRRETEWLRRGAKARTTKQTARINRAAELLQATNEISDRNLNKTVRMDMQNAEKNPKKLVEALGISKAYNGKTIINPIDVLITPGTRLGLLGQNGSGKSTLIKVLLGQEKSDTGVIKHSEHLKVLYFEQNRESLDQEATVMKALCPAGEYVHLSGRPVHVRGYLDRFLFRPEQYDMPVKSLSGGEQARLLLAKLLLTEANLLVLDEPTNDLDMATLNVLEDLLLEYEGAVILVTHDRYFMDRVSNKLFSFGLDAKGNKKITTFASLAQWELDYAQNKDLYKSLQIAAQNQEKNAAAQSGQQPVVDAKVTTEKKRKLSYKEQRELETMEETILVAEKHLEDLTAKSQEPKLATNSIELAKVTKELSTAEAEVARLYARWSELNGT